MKKLYTFLSLAVAFAMTASAHTMSHTALKAVDSEVVSAKFTKSSPKHAVAKAEEETTAPTSLEGVVGMYDLEYTSALKNDEASPYKSTPVSLRLNEAGDGLIFSVRGFELEANYNTETGELSFPADQDLGWNEYNQIQVYFYHIHWNKEGTGLNYLTTPLTAKWENGSFAFEDDEDIIGIGNKTVGWFLLGYELYILGQEPWVDDMPVEGWEDFKTCEFIEGWYDCNLVSEGIWESIDAHPYDVVVEQNPTYGLYRIVNPYGATWAGGEEATNMDPTGKGYILFDITDPDFVRVQPMVYSGLTTGNGSFLMCNIEGYYWYYREELELTTLDEVKDALWEDGLEDDDFSKYADGVVNFNNCRFGTTAEPIKAYVWVNAEEQEIPMYSILKLGETGGVEDVTVDDNAPAAYYNLQGIRVNEPAGGIYIKVQNGKSTKVNVVR